MRSHSHGCLPSWYCQMQKAGTSISNQIWIICYILLQDLRHLISMSWGQRIFLCRGVEDIFLSIVPYKNLVFRPTLLFTRAFQTASRLSTEIKVLRDSPLDGTQPSWATLLKVLESSVSTRCLRMFTSGLLDLIRLHSIKLLVSLSLQHALRLSLIPS